MNILFCDKIEAGTLVGGSVHKYEVMSHLARMGHDIVTLGGDFLRSQAGTETNHEIPAWRRAEIRLLQWPIVRLFRGGLSILGICRHEIYTFLLTFITILRRRRRFDIIYRRHAVLNSEYILAKLFRIPLVKEVNGIVAAEKKVAKQADRFSLWVIGKIESFNMSKADKIIVVTSKLKEILQKDYRVPGDKITVIPNGANTDLFKPMAAARARRKLGLAQASSYICFVGSLERWQGVDDLMKSIPSVLERCPETQFLVVGDGSMKQELVELAEQVGVSDKVIFTGMVPYQKVPWYVNASDICVAPFVRERNERLGVSPLKLCEYLACGRPVVASRVPGLEVLEQNDAGTLVPPENLRELAKATVKLLQDKELRKQMGENGRKYVVENQSWGSVAQRVANVLSEVVTSASREEKHAGAE